ncbi:MAG: hypothetical protein LLG37_01650 [Spirochaetia bacterium]|nr:hypothetical protein [Spirochaetia bacterium]
MERGKGFMLINYDLRLFGAVLVLLKKSETDTVDTAAVSAGHGEGTLLYNRAFLESPEFKDRVFVMMHEASHLILASMSRRGNREKVLWNYATDIIINELIRDNFGVMPPEDCLQYKFLKDAGFTDSDVPFTARSVTADEVYTFMVSAIETINEKDGIVEIRLKTGKKLRFRSYGEGFDDEDMDPGLKEKIGEVVRDHRDAGGKSGTFIRRLTQAAGVYFPFADILRKYFDRREYDFSRKNRRLKAEGTFFPRRKNPRFRVYAAIDVSGSCFDYTEMFLAYIMALPEFEEVDFFDTGILKTMKKGDTMPVRMNGYGGTDLNPVLEKWKRLEAVVQDAKPNFIVLTDGYIAPVQCLPRTEVLVFTTGIEIAGCRNIRIR